MPINEFFATLISNVQIESEDGIPANLKKEREELKRKYEKARRLRDEALQQNTFQLARLTVLGIPKVEPARKTEPNSM